MTARKKGFLCFVSFVWVDEVPLKRNVKKKKKKGSILKSLHTHTHINKIKKEKNRIKLKTAPRNMSKFYVLVLDEIMSK